MKNLFIFPVGEEIESALKHEFFLQYSTLYSWNSVPNSRSFQDLKLILTNLWDDIFDKCSDALIVQEEKVAKEQYDLIIKQLLKSKINIYAVRSIVKILDLTKEDKERIHIISHDLVPSRIMVKQLVPINVPVIAILGDGKFTEKFQVQIALHNYFQKSGFKVLSVTAKEYASLLGMIPLPYFIFKPMPLSDKIVALNQYFYSRIFSENLDLILVDVPGGVRPISEQYVNDFGEFAYSLCNALSPDVLIRTLYFNDYNIDFFINDMTLMKYRYNVVPEYYYISSTSLVYPPSLLDELSYLKIAPHTKKEFINNLRSYDLPCDIFDYNEEQSVEYISKKIIASLSSPFSIV